ncbi:solute carrier organic anion transporter family member 2A1-like isoform X2 [Heterodontus francisci]|uniref:solute carrier organic anion transporter family member 2A1-like isoform X2 n=1 Tax=Heterodontus francisci TaxID=7792 RepID=UPI00355B7194
MEPKLEESDRVKLEESDRVKPRLSCRPWIFNNIKIGNTLLIIFVSYFGSRVHRPRLIGMGGLLLCLGAFLLTLPHFISERYEYTKSAVGNISQPDRNTCQPVNHTHTLEYCAKSAVKSYKLSSVWVILVIAQLMAGIGTVPIQPFGISYVDDFAEPTNSPLYIAILFAISVFGPSFGYLLGSVMLRVFVDLDKVNTATIDLKPSDPRWIGAWWLGLLVSSGILAITSIPYFFFPRQMIRRKKSGSEADMMSEMGERRMDEMTATEFIKLFPKMLVKLLLNPVFIITVLSQCCFSSVLAGLSTYFNKFLEKQYSTTISNANFLIGSVTLPTVAIGMLLGGIFMKRYNLSLAKIPWYSLCILAGTVILTIPLFFMGCSTQKIAGINYSKDMNSSTSFTLKAECNAQCFCFDYVYNPVCGVDAIEYISPCQAGCTHSTINHFTGHIVTYNNCTCIQTSTNEDYAHPGHCRVSCSNLLLPMVFSISLIGMIACFTHNPLYMLVLRVVRREEKSFAIGVQFLILRLFAWLPAPALFGAVIDTTCIRWSRTCSGKTGACHYYDTNLLRIRYFGLHVMYKILGVLLLLAAGWKAKKFSVHRVSGQNTEAV